MSLETSAPRALTRDDAEAVAALIRLAFAALPVQVDPPPSALGETAATVAATLSEGGGSGIDAALMLAAAVLWLPRDDGLYVARLSVHPGWRGRGLGRALLAEVERQARTAGLRHLQLSTRLAMAGNRALFAACGFVETTLHAHPGYASPTYVSLEKKLV